MWVLWRFTYFVKHNVYDAFADSSAFILLIKSITVTIQYTKFSLMTPC